MGMKDESIELQNEVTQKAITEKPLRKRKWGLKSISSKTPTVNISTESLKGLIPEIKPSAIIAEPLVDLEQTVDVATNEDEEEEGEIKSAAETEEEKEEN